jgi:heterodisulfide reductase subunit A
MGHPVTLVEEAQDPGGLLTWGIPPFRLPPEALKRDLDRILTLPIDLKCNQPTDEGSLAGLVAEHQAVFLATGAAHHQSLGLAGEDLMGVIPGLAFLRHAGLQAGAKGARVLVIGGGNTAMDAARTALRRGAENVTVLYRRTREEMPAFADEVTEAEEEGVMFRFLSGPVAFLGGNRGVEAVRFHKMRLTTPGGDGRPRPEPREGSEEELACDLVLVAAGQSVEPVTMLKELRFERGRIWVDTWGRTSKSGLFAGGDLTPARASVVDAMASGKRAALAIHLSLLGKIDMNAVKGVELGEGPAFSIAAFFNRPSHWDPHHVVLMDELDRLTSPPASPAEVPHLNPVDRKGSFEEVVYSMGADQTLKEAGRCFFCGSCVGCDKCYIFCPEGAVIPPEKEGETYVAHNDYCKGCGTCATVCVRGILENKEGA